MEQVEITKRDEILAQFLSKWPLGNLKNITLEQYHHLKEEDNSNNGPSFCHWLESVTDIMGSIWGGSAYKFGIFQWNKQPEHDGTNEYDTKYAWYKKYGVTREEAFNKIKTLVISTAELSTKGSFTEIDEIDLGNAFKWKIAFLYSNKKLIPVYNKNYLLNAAKSFGIDVDKSISVSKLQEILLARQGNQDIYSFGEKILKSGRGSTDNEYSEINDPMEKDAYIDNKYINLLLANHNLILTGAPGTGKTYMANDIASQMILSKSFNELTDLEKEKLKNSIQYDLVQFHPSYDYTDFVEGLRPKDDGKGNIGFERKDGVFKEFCAKALNDPDNNYVFIIDEINRGEISKIFGELFFSIDPGYRGEAGKVKTQYQNLISGGDVFSNGFFVPENVYIIGTMNDIDRSVESMDFAMRRRFAFKEITAAESAENMQIPIETRFRMQRLNNEIAGTEGLNTSYQIGAAYFRNCKNFQDLWDMKLSGLLKEYLRGMDNDGSKFDKLEDAYFGNLNSDPQENNGNN